MWLKFIWFQLNTSCSVSKVEIISLKVFMWLIILGLHVTSWRPCWWNFNKRMLISFYCTWHQHGRYVFVFWISRDWLQTINTQIICFNVQSKCTKSLKLCLPNPKMCKKQQQMFTCLARKLDTKILFHLAFILSCPVACTEYLHVNT